LFSPLGSLGGSFPNFATRSMVMVKRLFKSGKKFWGPAPKSFAAKKHQHFGAISDNFAISSRNATIQSNPSNFSGGL